MKRSEINSAIRALQQLAEQYSFRLPPFAAFTPEELAEKKNDPAYREIFDCALGWDITDFGRGNFAGEGLTLFTIRNGKLGDAAYPKPYAEKLMLVQEDQSTPFHYHAAKMEDIINRGGGVLAITLYNSASPTTFADTPVSVYSDGRVYTIAAGSTIYLHPGESITMQRGLFHEFHGLKGEGPVLVGEVSSTNDDVNDNFFYKPTGRFPEIEEDEAPLHSLVSEY